MAPIFNLNNTVLFEYSPLQAILICFSMAVIYVGSLYVWTKGNKARDHPDTIKGRFVRVTIVCLLVFPALRIMATDSHSIKAQNIFTWVGIRLSGYVTSLVLPLILTMVLFLGPLVLHYMDGIFHLYAEKQYWVSSLRNLMWIRNHIMAPITEEFIFRACMMPFLVPTIGEGAAVFVCPLFFGIAHIHHLREKLEDGTQLKVALFQCLFQFSYTTVFGAYSAFLFLRTGHLAAPVVAHAFCNHMGFPDFQEVRAYKKPARYYIVASFILGVILWYYMLYPLTQPWIYDNDLYELS